MSKSRIHSFRPVVVLVALLLLALNTSVEAQGIFKKGGLEAIQKRSVRALTPLKREQSISVEKAPVVNRQQQKITLTTINLDQIPIYQIPLDETPVVTVEQASHLPPPPTINRPTSIPGFDQEIIQLLKEGITSQQDAGHHNYNPTRAYVVDPSKQELSIVNLSNWTNELTIPVSTGKNGIGFGRAQTPTGFFTMGGVRIAKNANAYIQTGDSKSGVSGVYAEILYPPSYYRTELRGRVPNNVIIHGFNPSVSSMLKQRHEQHLIGRLPCTTGCPVPAMNDLPKLAPYLKNSAGRFDPATNPNSNLRSLIRKRLVVEHENKKHLGDPILILERPFR